MLDGTQSTNSVQCKTTRMHMRKAYTDEDDEL